MKKKGSGTTLQEDRAAQNRGHGQRMAGLELLRCVAMMMVVALHYLGKGGLLADLTGENLGALGTAAWLLESFCIVAVNVYMLISGYFLCKTSFKLSRLVGLWMQVWVYSIGFGMLGALTGILEEVTLDVHYLLTLVLPISMEHYWFMTSYFFLYLLLPFVGMSAGRMTKGQLKAAVGSLLFVFCFVKSILPLRLETDGQGYDCLWYLCVFLAAAYIRRFVLPAVGDQERDRGFGEVKGFTLKKRGCCLGMYVGGCLLIFGVTIVLREIYLCTGSLGRNLKMCLEYNHLLPFLAAVGLFGTFYSLRIQGKPAEIVNRVAPDTLGVYLLHENLGLRYSWQNWFGAERLLAMASADTKGGFVLVGALLLCTAGAVLCVFLCGILVDMARSGIFRVLHRVFSHVPIYGRMVILTKKVDCIMKRD